MNQKYKKVHAFEIIHDTWSFLSSIFPRNGCIYTADNSKMSARVSKGVHHMETSAH